MRRAAGRLHRRTTTAICFVALLLIVARLLIVTGSSYSKEGLDVPGVVGVPSPNVPPAILATTRVSVASSAERETLAGNPLGGCGQCHVDVVDELAVSLHLKKGIDCVKCHGPSKGHSADENNEVKPDRVIPRKQVDAFCGECHKCSRPAEPPPAAAEEKRQVCIDCHGAHDLRPPKP